MDKGLLRVNYNARRSTRNNILGLIRRPHRGNSQLQYSMNQAFLTAEDVDIDTRCGLPLAFLLWRMSQGSYLQTGMHIDRLQDS